MIKKNIRIESIDVLRGMVMIIMALDHVRDYFHYDAFFYSPTDLAYTNVSLFFTRFITHYCAPVFVFLAGISACLYGTKRTKRELSIYLFTRGLWLVFAEIFIVTLGWTFNPTYPLVNFQVIWVIGLSMVVLSLMIYMKRLYILFVAVSLIALHNIFDDIHLQGNGLASFLWSILHEPKDFDFGLVKVFVRYPLMPWIGIIALGFYFGGMYSELGDGVKRKRTLFYTGIGAVTIFVTLRYFNLYGDPAKWSVQNEQVFSVLSFLNVSKYPPSFLYALVTIGPAMIFLSMAEKPLNAVTKLLAVFGRTPFFYYVLHIYLIHFLAVIAAGVSGYEWSEMILSDRVNRVAALTGYGFSLPVVYLVWVALIVMLYPACKWFDSYKRSHQSTKTWLTYL